MRITKSREAERQRTERQRGEEPSKVLRIQLAALRFGGAVAALGPINHRATGPVRGCWMRSQLLAQYHGLSGRGWLDRSTQATESAWLGGSVGANGPMAEAFPYWLNGALPLAVLLNDTEMLGDIRSMFSTILKAVNY